MKPSLDIEVTRRCNLRCEHCFVGWSRDWHTDMPLDVALAIIEEGAGLFPLLHVTGGEPFAYRGLFALIEAGIRHGYGEILINTNGTLVTPEAVVKLATHGSRVALSVSLDGPAFIHDRLRGAGQFEKANDAVTALLAAGVRVTVMTVVTPEVLRELSPFVFDLKARFPGLAGLTLFPVGVGPKGSQKPGTDLRPLSADELAELALHVALIQKTGLLIGIGAYPMVNPLLKALGYPEALLYQCTAGRGRVCVHADLSVSSCHPIKDPIYGTWQPGLLRRLHTFVAHQRLARRDFDGCRSCEHQEACGHCRAFVTASGEPLFGNDNVCHEVLPGRPQGKPRVRLPVVTTVDTANIYLLT
jgi:radical SAM protein with 4Fe4S-binding SPASM domain